MVCLVNAIMFPIFTIISFEFFLNNFNYVLQSKNDYPLIIQQKNNFCSREVNTTSLRSSLKSYQVCSNILLLFKTEHYFKENKNQYQVLGMFLKMELFPQKALFSSRLIITFWDFFQIFPSHPKRTNNNTFIKQVIIQYRERNAIPSFWNAHSSGLSLSAATYIQPVLPVNIVR